MRICKFCHQLTAEFMANFVRKREDGTGCEVEQYQCQNCKVMYLTTDEEYKRFLKLSRAVRRIDETEVNDEI